MEWGKSSLAGDLSRRGSGRHIVTHTVVITVLNRWSRDIHQKDLSEQPSQEAWSELGTTFKNRSRGEPSMGMRMRMSRSEVRMRMMRMWKKMGLRARVKR